MLRLSLAQAAIWSTLAVAVSSLRCLPLLISRRPRTPLRLLCIIAFDMLAKLRDGAHLPQARLSMLAALLDFGACINALLDSKRCCRRELRSSVGMLKAGLRRPLLDYLRRLRRLERGRPSPGHGRQQLQAVRRYRENVVRLSLAMALVATGSQRVLDDAMQTTYDEGGLDLLFRLAMLCQVLDDLLDYSRDKAAGLPSFLTAAPSLTMALAYTRQTANNYYHVPGAGRTELIPLRVSLALLAAGAMLVCRLYSIRPSHLKPAMVKASRAVYDKRHDASTS
jgi:hypothetical protein